MNARRLTRSGPGRADLIEALGGVPFDRYVLITGERDLGDDPLARSLKLRPLASFTGSLIASEGHQLYLAGVTLGRHE